MLGKLCGVAGWALLATAAAWPTPSGTGRRLRPIALNHAELKLTPAALVFNREGELYVGYRDKGTGEESSAIWVRVFDPSNAKELRSVQLQTATVRLPNGAEQFLLSPDDSLLLYAQFHGGTLIAVLNASALTAESTLTALPDNMSNEFPKISGLFDDTVLVTSEMQNKRNGVDVRLVSLDANLLTRVLIDRYIYNPYIEAVYAVDRNGNLWLTSADALYRYNPRSRKSDLEVRVPTSAVPIFLTGDQAILLYTDRNEFGELYRVALRGSAIQHRQLVKGCGIDQIRLSPDELYGVALCEHQNTGEWRFGAITARSAVIFGTGTLKILAQVPIEKDLYPELAIWHGDGRIVLATQADSNKLAIYEFQTPRPARDPAATRPGD